MMSYTHGFWLKNTNAVNKQCNAMCCNCEYLHEIMRDKLSGKDFANVLREFVSCNIFLYYKCFLELRCFVREQFLFLVV